MALANLFLFLRIFDRLRHVLFVPYYRPATKKSYGHPSVVFEL